MKNHGHSILRSAALLALAGVILVHGTACSFFASGRQAISVTSHPAGAEVAINGNFVGATPLQYSINRSDSAAIMVSKDGYHPSTRVTSRRLSTTGVLDVIGGILFLICSA